MFAEQQSSIRLALEILQHLALTAAGRALVHKDRLVFIRRFDERRRCVAADPALMLADIQKHRVHALFGRGSRVKIVREDLVERFAAVVDHDLLAVKVRVPEGRRNVDNRARGVIFGDILNRDKPLHVGKRQREERRVRRANEQAVIPVRRVARLKRQHNHALLGQPVHRLLPHLREGIAEPIEKTRLVGRKIVTDDHRIGVTPAHIVFHEVYRRAVFAADDLRFLDASFADDVVNDIIAGRMRRTEDELV